MISCLLIHLTRDIQGIATGRELLVTGEVLSIGRGAASKIHLSDHGVRLHHATIKRSESGDIWIEAVADALLSIDGTLQPSARLMDGMRIEIGPYELNVLPGRNGSEIALSVELSSAHLREREAAYEQRRSPLTLSALGMSKRRMSYGLIAAIMLLFVVLPLLPSFSAKLDHWQAEQPVTMNASWSPGELAGGHAAFGDRCSTCHQKPFQPVDDKVCLGCHQKTASHYRTQADHAKLAEKPHCVACHTDHKGKAGLENHDSAHCTACHANLKLIAPSTRLLDANDFQRNHPSFRLAGASGVLSTLPQGTPTEDNGLKYSHRVHLDAKGVSSPNGDVVMACQDCHRLEDSGQHFQAIQMKRDCQQSGCHGQVYDMPLDGDVPHGSVDAVVSQVRTFYLEQVVAKTPFAGDCTQHKDTEAVMCASRLANEFLTTTQFLPNAGCGECHHITADEAGGSWRFSPVKITRDWFPLATFSHSKHGTQKCEACHDKKTSNLSSDVSMPSPEKCRECHAGEKAVRHKQSSRCNDCHLFHDGTQHFQENSPR